MSYDRPRTRNLVLLVLFAASARVAICQPREPTLLYARIPDSKGWEMQISTHGLGSGVTTPISEPLWGSWASDWSAGGRRIVYGGTLGLTVVDWRGADPGRFAEGVMTEIFACDWSPDGQWLAYSAVAGDESGIRRRNPTGVDEITLSIGNDIDARWSKNGQWIAFKRQHDDGSTGLIVMDKDGDKETVVAAGILATNDHDWTPDSKQLVYVSESSGNAEVFTTKHDGKDTEQLTSNRVIDSSPIWNSKGSAILFLSEGD
ncbi:hypothetical protein HN937_17995, partial [Candidatus Poribacteria bacterium]|nr:hypothetical protein [Candidatus Poribacteria bacterium]